MNKIFTTILEGIALILSLAIVFFLGAMFEHFLTIGGLQ